MLTIHPVALPELHTDPLWAAYQRCARVYNHELLNGPEWDISDEESLKAAQADDEHRMARFVALDGETPVGYANYYIHLQDSPEEASPIVYVIPEYRGRGIGTALVEALREALAAENVTRLVAWTLTPLPDDGPVVRPPSGIGAIRADHPGIRMALGHGFELAQVERVSRYDVDAPAIDPEQARDEAAAVAGPNYEVIAFAGDSPEELRAGIAVLKQRMSTDVPSGELTVNETSWDAARVVCAERNIQASQDLWRAVVVHRPTGDVVALNELVRPRGNPVAFLEQWDTIVLPEHRGHRLGMLVKAANLLQVRDAVPDARAVITWNAEENRPMLNVNEALGFRPILVEAALQRQV